VKKGVRQIRDKIRERVAALVEELTAK